MLLTIPTRVSWYATHYFNAQRKSVNFKSILVHKKELGTQHKLDVSSTSNTQLYFLFILIDKSSLSFDNCWYCCKVSDDMRSSTELIMIQQKGYPVVTAFKVKTICYNTVRCLKTTSAGMLQKSCVRRVSVSSIIREVTWLLRIMAIAAALSLLMRPRFLVCVAIWLI